MKNLSDMKRGILSGLTIVLAIVMLSGCQWAAKKTGGDYTVTLPEDHKLIDVSWKSSDLWYLTRPMVSGDEPETYTYTQDSNFGVFEGTVTIIETKKTGGN